MKSGGETWGRVLNGRVVETRCRKFDAILGRKRELLTTSDRSDYNLRERRHPIPVHSCCLEYPTVTNSGLNQRPTLERVFLSLLSSALCSTGQCKAGQCSV